MSSNIDATKPAEGHAYTQDMRDNFAAAKSEIEALQAQRFTGELNFKDYISAAQLSDFAAGVLSFDAGVPLQAAIDAASALATYAGGQNVYTVRVPSGQGKIEAAQLVVKARVNLKCEGSLQNALASTVTPYVWFKAGSHCELFYGDANSKNGIQFGENGVFVAMRIGKVVVTGINTGAGRYGCLFVGSGFNFDDISTDLGLYGVSFGDGVNNASFIRGNRIKAFNGLGGVALQGGQDIHIDQITCDSCQDLGILIDKVHDVTLGDVSCFFDDTVGGSCFSAGYAALVGNGSGGDNISGLRMSLRVMNTGGEGLRISNIKHSMIELMVNRGVLPTGNTHNVTTAIQYGAGVDASVLITGDIDSAVTPYSGAVGGSFAYWNGTQMVNSGPVIAPSFIIGSAANGTLKGEVVKAKSVDESVTSSTVLQNDDHLNFAIAANEEWKAEFTLSMGAALATTGMKVAVTTPAGATQEIVAEVLPTTFVAANTCHKRTPTSGTALDFTAATQATQADVEVVVRVWVLNGATPGTVQLQWAQSTSSGTALTARKGSSMKASRIA